MFVTYRDQDREQKKAPAETWQWKRCSGQTITDKTGLQLCAEMSLPSGKEMMIMPISGPAVAKIYLNKLDTYRGLHFDASYTQVIIGARQNNVYCFIDHYVKQNICLLRSNTDRRT